MTNLYNKTLTDTSATCPVTGKAWKIGDSVLIDVPSQREFDWVGKITKFRTVQNEIFADVVRPMNFGSFKQVHKLSELVGG